MSVGGKPLPLLVWDRQAGKLVEEFMDDHPATYDSRPRRSLTQWLESRRLYDWLIAAYQNSRWSARQIAPFISKHQPSSSPDHTAHLLNSSTVSFCRARVGFRLRPNRWERSPKLATSPGRIWLRIRNFQLRDIR